MKEFIKRVITMKKRAAFRNPQKFFTPNCRFENIGAL